jgi:hypothetical protein
MLERAKEFRNKVHSSRRDLVKLLESLTAIAKVATVLGSIPASSDTVEGAADKAVWNKVQSSANHCYVNIIFVLTISTT